MKGKNGQVFRKNKEIANCLNEHFNSIGHKLASEITPTISENTTLEPPDNSIYIFDTFDEEIRKLIDRLKINKAPGLDGINNYNIKAHFPQGKSNPQGAAGPYVATALRVYNKDDFFMEFHQFSLVISFSVSFLDRISSFSIV